MDNGMAGFDIPREKDYPPYINDIKRVVVMYRGSIAHGMYVPPTDPQAVDDRDVVGIVIPPPEYYLGLKVFKTQQLMVGPWDWVVWDLRHFVAMLSKANPNALPALWTDRKYYIKSSGMWGTLMRNRELFATKQAYHSFKGYGLSQCKRMAKDENAYQGYMGEKRKALVDKYGYDIKMAAHSVRLLRMGREFLLSGEMLVDRGDIDADELLAIKQGEWKAENVRGLVDHELAELDAAYVSSPLPEKPDFRKVNDLLTGILLREYR